MKNITILTVLMIILTLPATAQYESIPLSVAKEIADKNAEALWGTAYPDSPIPCFGPDGEVLAYRFNYSLGKPFPDPQSLKEQCQEYAMAGDKKAQWGCDKYGRILMGARDNMAVIHEHTTSLSQEYALGYKFEEKAKKILGEKFQLVRVYYINHANQWHCYSNGSEQVYINLFPPARTATAAEFQHIITDQGVFCKTGNYQKDWKAFINGKTLDNKAVYFIPNLEHCPFLDWSYGCSPTAAAMALGWWDYNSNASGFGFGKLIGYYYQRYDDPENEWDYQVANLQLLLAIGMETDTLEGSTNVNKIDDGIEYAANTILGYNFDATRYNTGSFWTKITSEISFGERPIQVSIEGHSTCGVGYNSSTDEVITYYTHDPPNHVVYIHKDDVVGVTTIHKGGALGENITLLHPLGDTTYNGNGSGEQYLEGEVCEISWSHAYTGGDVDIYLSTNGHGGAINQYIATGTPNDGEYDWLIPSGINSDKCRIVIQLDDPVHGIVASDGSKGNFSIQPGGSIPTLIQEMEEITDSDPDYFKFEHFHGMWAVVGLRNNTPDEDWDIKLFSDATFTSQIAHSWGEYCPVEFVVLDGHHIPVQYRGIKAYSRGATGNATVEFEAYTESLSPGTNNVTWSAGEVVEMWDVHLTPGIYTFTLDYISGSADLDMAIYSSTGGTYYGKKTDWMGRSNYLGYGNNETFTVNIDVEDDYGFCVWANDGNSATFDIIIEENIPGVWKGTDNEAWHWGSNWTLSMVPDASMDVVIPAGTPYSPRTDYADGTCNNITIEPGATLDIYDHSLNVTGNLEVRGALNMTNFYGVGDLNVSGDVTWASGSTANIYNNAEMFVEGDWTFEAGSNVHLNNGYVEFMGSGHSLIYSRSDDSWFNHFGSDKDPGGFVANENTPGSRPLVINGDFYGWPGSDFINYSFNSVILRGDEFYNPVGSEFHFPNGAMIFDGVDATITANAGSYFNDLIISSSGTVQLQDPIVIEGDLLIESGVFQTNSHTIEIQGDWDNDVGFSAFVQGTGTVIFNGTGIQFVEDESFYTLELDKPWGDLRFLTGASYCTNYEWTQGAMRVCGGSFTAYDLEDDGIFGTITVTDGTLNLHQDPSQYVDLRGFLTISGGTMNVNGGGDDSFWPYNNDASITMSGGVLDFKDVGIEVRNSAYTFSEDITGGTIRTSQGFTVERTDFTPAGGWLELYGPDDGDLGVATGSNLHSLRLYKTTKGNSNKKSAKKKTVTDRFGNKSTRAITGTITALTDLDINGDFLLDGGSFIAPANIYIAGDWTNLVSAAAFEEGTNNVTFDGTTDQNCNGETFYHLTLDKSAGRIIIGSNDVHCTSYDHQDGGVRVDGPVFYAADLADNGIYGEIELVNGTIEWHQGTSSGEYVDLCGDLTISGGTMNIYGGADNSYWPYLTDASLTMSQGSLDFKSVGVRVYNTPSAGFIEDINGGTIRTSKGFIVSRNDFTPAGGTVECYGTDDASVSTASGSHFHHLTIHKAAKGTSKSYGELELRDGITEPSSKANTIQLAGDTEIEGNLSVEESVMNFNGKGCTVMGDMLVTNAAQVILNDNSKLYKGSGSVVYITGGNLTLTGSAGAEPRVASVSGYYGFKVAGSGTLGANRAIFENMNYAGINLAGGSIDPALPLDYCIFRDGEPASGAVLLNIDNSQNITVTGASFPVVTATGAFNVSKGINSGDVIFMDATGAFAGAAYENDPYGRIHWQSSTGFQVDLKVNLEGPFNGATMDADLNTGGFLPLAQPYTGAPWFYSGSESVASIPDPAVIDWALIELRDTTEAKFAVPSTMIARQAAFLMSDGTVRGMDAASLPQFNTSVSNGLFAVIWHRNHIGVMSPVQLTGTSGVYSWDFSTGSGQAYGGSLAHKEIASGIWGMTGADGNGDQQINNGDKNDVWAAQAGTGGYRNGDFNMDSQVNNGDKNDIWNPNTGLGGQVPE